MDGWQHVDGAALAAAAEPLGAWELRRFFDGGQPGWRHAVAPQGQVPRRQVVAEAVRVLRHPGRQTMVLLAGPGGAGRSTALLQAAVDLVAVGHRVLRRSTGAALDPAAVAALPAGPAWVLVSDDADEIAHDIGPAVEGLCRAGRRDVHWLLTARDTAWDAALGGDGHGFEPSWDRLIELWPAPGDRAQALAVTAEDAAAVVAAWEGAGGLGALTCITAAERSSAVLAASSPTLLGVALELRHGPDGLPGHLEAALGTVAAGARRAFLYAAAAEAAGAGDVDLAVVADLVGRPEAALVADLTTAGLAVGTGGALRLRHAALARAAVALMGAGRAGASLDDVLGTLVRATGLAVKERGRALPGAAVVTSGPGLSARLRQLGLAAADADQVACDAADAAELVLSGLLVVTVARSRTYRHAGRLPQASTALRAALSRATEKDDWATAGRSYLYEMSRCEGELGKVVEGILLAGLSIGDAPGLEPPTTTDARLALAQMGAACMRSDDLDPALRRLLRVSAQLGPGFTPTWDQRTRSDFRRYAVLADDLGIPACSTVEACDWLAEAVTLAAAEVLDPSLNPLRRLLAPAGDQARFRLLRTTLQAA